MDYQQQTPGTAGSNRLTFGGMDSESGNLTASLNRVVASEDYPIDCDYSGSSIEKQASITAIEDDEEEGEPHRRTI